MKEELEDIIIKYFRENDYFVRLISLKDEYDQLDPSKEIINDEIVLEIRVKKNK